MKNRLYGNEIDRMPDFTFRVMKVLFAVYYFFRPAGKYLSKFGIKPGYAVVDYGCGTGAFIRDTAAIVGTSGIVYAVDIHEMAIANVRKLITKYNLSNVKTVLTDGGKTSIEDEAADLIFALDMFHMVSDTDSFLKELNRITKKNGTLIIEDGHQPRSLTKEKILRSGCWEILGEEKRYLQCIPLTRV
ncbi:MAG TPA: class I SAM-dependent methyltransferase [Bacteroidales bacterium]|nr:class I SAM-dependent methyltransferase [Bacteroidales bacterium]